MDANDREDFAAFLLRMRKLGISDKNLLSAVEAVPRREFIARSWHSAAYGERMVPIDCGEVIEGLDMQARILTALDLEPGHRVLEVGTGSGYTAALMSKMAAKVTTVERYRRLAEDARGRLQNLAIDTVTVHHADGRAGLAAEGPFDRIIFWAAFEALPRNCADWLATNGVMIAPIGPGDGVQQLAHLAKIGSRFERTDLFSVRFQPLAEGVAASL